jgi:hypothetical protein
MPFIAMSLGSPAMSRAIETMPPVAKRSDLFGTRAVGRFQALLMKSGLLKPFLLMSVTMLASYTNSILWICVHG